ncbi:S8 family serine peptidase [Anaerosalibacter massiliensis]|uniref:S8 family peptidase n=1 Tax=Anaerosalibacter massiliensis TaxID=1347392 RepID=A0A9X2MFH4_9FIRM|nr:S8 family serine peptidase [Anaerosalibacter massiliensis]MCR2044047.1 S8 family peptidase [Anaerosalibacter massiliensis]
MRRFFCLLMIMVILLVGCSPSKIIETESSESSDQSEKYNTLLSPDNKLGIVRKPYATDYSSINSEKMTDLPSYNSDSDEIWQIDLRSRDLTNIDLSKRFDDLIYADFDNKTQWPDKLPDGFDPQMIMELGKNPGLGLRELHKKGITGKGIGLAIIDQSLLVDHIEYKEQLKMYEEIHCWGEKAQMHGSAVASIAVGKTVGVAPEADLYYIAETHGVYNEQGEYVLDLTWTSQCIDRIVEINKTLPEEKKIRVISISLGIGQELNGYEKVFDSIEKAKQDGIYTIYVESDPYLGLDRDPLKDPDDINSFTKGRFWKDMTYSNDKLLIPMDSRCTASPTGVNDYVLYRNGGISWVTPYVAGLYALACQVRPDITPEIFWSYAFNTSDTIFIDNSNEEQFGKIVNPVRLIENIEKMK